MAEGFEHLGDGELLAVIDAALGALGDDRVRLPSDAEQLSLLAASLRVDARLRAWQALLAARIEGTEAAWREHRTSTATWLAEAANLTRREAGRLVATGLGLERFAVVAQAAGSGVVLPSQAAAITAVLDGLPEVLPVEVVARAQELMVGFAASHNAVELRRLGGRLVEVLAPEIAETAEAERLEREHRVALRNRHLSLVADHQGSVLIRGSLPVADAEPLIRIIDAYAAARKGVDRLDPHAELVSPAMRRADALVTLVHHHTQQALAPTHGGDRPRVVVMLSYDKLVQAAADATPICGQLLGSGDPVAPGVLRRWLCDADILPVVLGGRSQVLDVGRTQRLVTPAIRAALEVRDQGCVFPGCDTPPQACHAHHLIPWWAGGPTSLTNMVLVCPHHHGIVEPGHDPTDDRWHVHIPTGHPPQVIPPRRVDPAQRPRIHARFLTFTPPDGYPRE